MWLLLVVLATLGLAAAQEDLWWHNAVVYQIYPKSFQDSDGNGVGDLQGIISRLDYLNETGVNAIWLSPIYKSPGVDNGYDISDFKAIDPQFGNMTDFMELLDEAHKRNIKVIMDFVPNHTSNQHPWFLDPMTKQNYYVWKEVPTTNPSTTESSTNPPPTTSNSLSSTTTADNSPTAESSTNPPPTATIDNSPTTKPSTIASTIESSTNPSPTPSSNPFNEKLREEDPKPPNNWVSSFGGPAWEFDQAENKFYYHRFYKEQPDLNYNNPEVVKAMQEVMSFWLDMGVDGFRIDAVSYLYEDENFPDASENYYPYKNQNKTFDMVYEWRKLLDNYTDSPRVMITEVYENMDIIQKYLGDDENPGAHLSFNFLLFMNNLDNTSKAEDFNQTVRDWIDNIGKIEASNWVIGNHDNSRVASRFGENMVDTMNMYLLLLPGMAVSYYGEEIGMHDNRELTLENGLDTQNCDNEECYQMKSRDFERTPMQWNYSYNAGFTSDESTPWLPLPSDYMDITVVNQTQTEERSHLKVYKELIKARNKDVFKKGSTHTAVKDSVFSFMRKTPSESLVVVMNVGNTEVNVTIPDLFGDVPSEYTVVTASVGSEISDEQRISTNNELTLQPKESVLLYHNSSPSVMKLSGAAGLMFILLVFQQIFNI